MRPRHHWLLVAALAACLAAVPSVASATAPYSTPPVIVSDGFEEGELQLLEYVPTLIPGEEVWAYWGETSLRSRTGTYSVWCAGEQSEPVTDVAAYPAYTRGRAFVDMDELADYYSSTISLWYVMPSVGSVGDSFGISLSRLEDGVAQFPSVHNDSDIPVAQDWAKRTYVLGAGSHLAASRQPMRLGLAFFDQIETFPLGYVGQGPAVDDIVISGYKFGPVRQLAATWSVEASGVALSWTPPQRSAISSEEETRPVVYRAWRSEVGTDTWVEVTPSTATSVCSIVDTSVVQLALYDYVVQAWDPVDGESYGIQSPNVRMVTPEARAALQDEDPPTTTVNAPSGWVSSPATVTMTATDTGSGVDSISYSLDGDAPATEYTGPIAISQHGETVVKYRAMDLFGNLEPVKQVTVSVDARAPETTASLDATLGAATVTLSAVDDGVGVASGTVFRLDGGPETSGTVVTVAGGGEHQVQFRSTDMVGNIEEWQTYAFELQHALSIEMTASATAVKYPNTITLRGVLLDESRSAVTSRTLVYEYSYDGVAWSKLATATTTGNSYVWTTRPSRRTYYRLVFPETSADSLHPSVVGAAVPVTVTLSMSTPSASSYTTYRYRTIKVSALVRPKHTSGVKFRFYHLEGSKWVLRKTVSAKYSTYNSTTTKVYCSASLHLRGKWRVKVYHAADTHPAQYSPYRSITVR